MNRYGDKHAPFSRRCHFYNTPERCRYGFSCKFQHAPVSHSQQIQNPNNRHPNTVTGGNTGFTQWRYLIPNGISGAIPLSITSLTRLFQQALKLVEGDVSTMQDTVRLLASEGGLFRIKELIGHNFDLPKDEEKKPLLELIFRFFDIITHPKVDSSIILEDHVGTIYNFIYGRQGDRATTLFNFILSDHSPEMDPCLGQTETILTVLAKVVEWNGHALVNQEIKRIAATLFDMVNHHELSNPQTITMIRKLRSRLDIGNAIKEVALDEQKIAKAKFHLIRDFPGNLSISSPRHDNDHADITKIRILPTSEEIKASRGEYMPVQDSSQWHLPALEGLLDRQFRLLREDTVGQLRDAIRAEIGRADDLSRHSRARIFTYQNLVVEDIFFNRWKGLQILISFDQPNRILNFNSHARQEWWQHTKRMQNDALICLLSQSDCATFCTVCETGKEPKESKKDSGDSSQSRDTRTLFDHPKRAFATVRLADVTTLNLHTIFSEWKKGSLSNRRLVEFPGIILPSFESTLVALQRMSQLRELSFAEYITYEEPNSTQEVLPPFYTTKQGFQFNLRDVMINNTDYHYKPGEIFDIDSFKANTQLDSAQAEALIESLKHSLALIQGPPGTGKSFTGIALIKVLLHIKDTANLGPIVCVCYTNHALDQLLEHLLDHGTIAKNAGMTREEKQQRYKLGQDLDEEAKEIQKLLLSLRNPREHPTIKDYLEVHHQRHFTELFQSHRENGDGFEVVDHHRGQNLGQWLNKGSRSQHPPRPLEILLHTSVHAMTYHERRNVYEYWVKEIEVTTQLQLDTALLSYQEQQSRYSRIRDSINLRCLQGANVVGVTTTGLAKNLDVLRKLPSKVLVCEEAGEVLEAHSLTTMLPALQHAILIGDHQQLPPHIQNFELSRENPRGQQYSLDLSLFERLVQPPDEAQPSLPFSMLETQRRMHPSISNLIRKTLYPQLQDSPQVENYSSVEGMKKRLFWLDHRHLEAGPRTGEVDTTSRSNDFEIEMAVALVTHLVRQSTYAENEIAIITPYLGQLLKIRRILSRSFELTLTEGDAQEIEKQGLQSDEDEINVPRARPAKISLLKCLKVSTIDNFQGEEAKVVIVSLVRSNEENKCGFLKTSNRINVLLSRAMHGMYIIGNSITSSHVKMWADVISMLKADGNFGDQLQLQCSRHPDTPILVSKPDDFLMFSPEGGCSLRCDRRLNCGHACINKCHSEALHNNVRCLEDCPRSLKGCDHSCPNRCGDDCVVRCQVKIRGINIRLPCGHHRNILNCWQFQEPAVVVCDDPVIRTIAGCGHEVKLACHINIDTQLCQAACGKILECGHLCQRKCFECRTLKDGVLSSENHGSCQHVCARPYTTCTHSCKEKCHGDKPCSRCTATCEIACSHSKCYKACWEPCAPCAEAQCASACPHQQCTMPCASPCNWLPCSMRCEKFLDCGHRCPTVCGEICPTSDFCQICADAEVKAMVVDYVMMAEYSELELDEDPCIIPQCGHLLALSSMDGHMEMSKHYKMDEIRCLDVNDTSKPFSMEEIKQCPKCRGHLRNMSRYGRIVRRALIDQSSKRFITWARGNSGALMQRLYEQQKGLEISNETAKSQAKPNVAKLKLKSSREVQMRAIASASGKRYKEILQLRKAMVQHLYQTSISEQPFKRVWDLVQHARRTNVAAGEMKWDPDAVQVGETLRVQCLLFRCDICVLTDFLSVNSKAQISIDVSQSKFECLELANDAMSCRQRLQEAEGHLFYARYCAMETAVKTSDNVNELIEDGKKHIEKARVICNEHPGTTRILLAELDVIEKMFSESTFYAPMNDNEWKEVLAAMKKELIGTGHWYTCENGHPFAVGECGGPMEETRCPECGSPVGGRDHMAAHGVAQATELDRRLGSMHI